MYLGPGKLVLASTAPSGRHSLDIRSDTGPYLGGGSHRGAVPLFRPRRPGGELRRRLPLDPHGPFGVARVALPSDSLGLYKEPLRPSKARTTLARPQGDGCGPSPCDPLGRRLRRCGRCRWRPRPPPTARAGRGRAPGREPDRARSFATGAAPRQGPARNPAQAPARGAGPGGGCRADP